MSTRCRIDSKVIQADIGRVRSLDTEMPRTYSPIEKISFIRAYSSAEGGTRTRMPRGATPSRWCVCQFHHFGEV
jgi:hypothetical protein